MTTSDQQNEASFDVNGNNLSMPLRILRALGFGFVGIFIFDNIFFFLSSFFAGREGALFILGVGGGSGVLAITAIRFTQWRKSASSVSRFAALFFLGALFGTVVGMVLYMLYMLYMLYIPSPSTTSTGPWDGPWEVHYRPPSWIFIILIANSLLVTLGAVTFRVVLLSVLGIWERSINYRFRLAVTAVVAVLCFSGAYAGTLTQTCGKIIRFGFELMSYVFRDRRVVYRESKELENAGPTTAHPSKFNPYTVDAYHVSRGTEKLDRDAATFEDLQPSWSKDKFGVYYNKDKRIPKADIASFRAIYLGRVEDKNYRYQSSLIDKIDPNAPGIFPVCQG